jgi:penicillin-binding protein 1A
MSDNRKISTEQMEKALGMGAPKSKQPKVKGKWHWFKMLFLAGFFSGCLGLGVLGGIFIYFMTQVPDFRTLADYKPLLVTKVYGKNGELISEYARERRIYTPIDEIPQSLINAYLAAEDADFYEHSGYDLRGIFRAALINTFTSRKQGASTITQQVAKTFLLSSERTYERKIKELILSRRIEKAFSKNEILELYLNQIYLGNGAYGVAAAAMAYYNKPLEELTIGQEAMLAGLPKAPSRYNPVRNPRQARWRRDVVLGRMRNEGFITPEQTRIAVETDLELTPKRIKHADLAPHFSEHVRKYVQDEYGTDELYEGGLNVYTTLDMALQRHAHNAVVRGRLEYDKRHGYRGPIGRVSLLMNWQNRLEDIAQEYEDKKDFGTVAAVLKIDDEAKEAVIGLPNGDKGIMPFEHLKWAREYISADEKGPEVKLVSDVLNVGDMIIAQLVKEEEPITRLETQVTGELSATTLLEQQEITYGIYGLSQIPKVQAALVALDVHTGAIRAMVGGVGDGTGFNRAVQAKRQAGSAFKPFVYSLALEKGKTPASIVLDAPVVLQTGEMDEKWKPHNYSEKVYGPSTLRRGLEKSRNLMTIRMAQELGIRNIIDYAHNFGLKAEMRPDLSTALGSASFNLLEMTSAYSVFPNKGKRTEPYFVEQIQNASGDSVFRAFEQCFECTGEASSPQYEPPTLDLSNTTVVNEQVAYQMVSLLQGVVQRGTAWRAKAVGRPVGAKTGTTNDYIDAWLMGFSPELAIGVWVGFDRPQTMGKNETGSSASGPIWTYFAKSALADKPTSNFEVPEGINFVRIDAETGGLPSKQTKTTIVEAFIEGTEPTSVIQPRRKENESTGVRSPKRTRQLYQGIY